MRLWNPVRSGLVILIFKFTKINLMKIFEVFVPEIKFTWKRIWEGVNTDFESLPCAPIATEHALPHSQFLSDKMASEWLNDRYLSGFIFCNALRHLQFLLTYFIPLVSFYSPWKHHEIISIPYFMGYRNMFSGNVKWDQLHEMG